jgi:predicted O-linked N-acetylglucosamine transferase (SPINDLY family)
VLAAPGDHLALYGRVDIALDTFPYHGTTTTCEALWMGVPVVTRAGETHASRVGVSLLTNAGVAELVATSDESYVEVATTLARDFPRLAGLRATLRERMAASPLMDGPLFARNLEGAYRQMWRTWCANQTAPSPS